MPDQNRIEDLLLEWETAWRAGNNISPENLCPNWPEGQAELRRRAELLRKFDAFSPTKTAPDDGTYPAAPPLIPGYSIRGELGRGGMGVVYRAWEAELDREVAVKVMKGGSNIPPEAVQRFIREARLLARLKHDHLVQIFSANLHDGQPYFVMELVEGGNLKTAAAEFVDNPRKAVAMMELVARVVNDLHVKGVLHRDLKPANILLDRFGRPKVSDFGLAKLFSGGSEETTKDGSGSEGDAHEQLTASGAVMGTPPYMAPEQFRRHLGDVSPRTDVWSLGVILWELLNGCRPFVADGSGGYEGPVCESTPIPPHAIRPNLELRLEAICLKCLQKSPEERYQTAGALADDLGRYLRDEQRRESWSWLPHGVKRRRFVAFSLSVTTAALSAILLMWGLGWTQSTSPISLDTQSAERTEPPLILIGEDGPPKEYHWLLGETEAVLTLGGDGKPFSLQSQWLSLLELPPRPPWQHYRMEAQVRQDAGDEGTMGIFVAHRRYDSVQGVYHSLWSVSFTEFRGRPGVAELSVVSIPETPPRSVGREYPVPRLVPPFKPEAGRWRTVAIEVNAEGMKAYLDEQCVGKGSSARLSTLSEEVLDNVKDVKGTYTPRGTLGIVVFKGTASFKEVAVKPLP